MRRDKNKKNKEKRDGNVSVPEFTLKTLAGIVGEVNVLRDCLGLEGHMRDALAWRIFNKLIEIRVGVRFTPVETEEKDDSEEEGSEEEPEDSEDEDGDEDEVEEPKPLKRGRKPKIKKKARPTHEEDEEDEYLFADDDEE